MEKYHILIPKKGMKKFKSQKGDESIFLRAYN